MAEPWRRLVGAAATALRTHPHWAAALNAVRGSSIGIHLAVMRKDEVNSILFGLRNLELRVSSTPSPPFGQVGRRDIVFLKYSGGQVAGVAEVGRVWAYSGLTPGDSSQLLQLLRSGVGGGGSRPQRLDGRRVTIMRLRRPVTIPLGLDYEKSNPRPWVVLRSSLRPALPRRFVTSSALRSFEPKSETGSQEKEDSDDL